MGAEKKDFREGMSMRRVHGMGGWEGGSVGDAVV